MCSILGGTKFDSFALDIFNKSKDRGRDYTGLSQYGEYWIANHRATPTNEKEKPLQNQPFGVDFKIVHNGTISNDKELGLKTGHIDSKILEKIINAYNIDTIIESLKIIKGSYAIAILKKSEIFLACNYKPIFYIKKDNEYYFSSLKNHLGKEALRVPPYSVMNLTTGETRKIHRTQYDNAIVICSGGLDSTAITGYVKKCHKSIKLLHFNYQCKATEREIKSIKKIARELKCEYEILSIDYNKFKGESSLFKKDEISTGIKGVEYALDWVYARNLIMLSIATGYAEANNYGHIYLGTNLEESGAYPDNEEQFIIDFNNLLYGAVNNGIKIQIHTPLGGLMKKEIVLFGEKYNSPLHLSYSCYNGGENHCGKCGPCYMRKKAFERAKIKDTTIYDN